MAEEDRIQILPSAPVTVSDIDTAEAMMEQEKEQAASFKEFLSAGFQEDNVLSYAFSNRRDFEPDETWGEQLDMEMFQELTADIPEEYHDFLDDTVSEAHARSMRERVLNSVENEKKMASWGWSGVALRMGINMLDPVAMFASAATGGLAATAIYANKASRIGRVIRGATAGAASNAAIEGYIASQSATRDSYDVLYAGTAGLLLGGGVGAISRNAGNTKELSEAVQSTAGSVEQAQKIDLENGAKQTILGDTSVGAMENPMSPSALMPTIRKDTDARAEAIETQEAIFDPVKGIPLRFDMAGRLLASKNPFFNKLGQILGEDAVAFRDGGTANIESTADLLKTNIMKGTFSRFYQTYNVEYKAWAKDSRIGFVGRQKLTNRRRFGELVADAIEDPDGVHHPAVKRMAQRNARLYNDLLKEAREYGVKGFEEIPDNLTYFTHRWNKFAINDMYQKHGIRPVIGLLKQGLIQGTTDLSDEAAEQIASVMLSKIRADVAGIDSGFSRLFNTESRDTLKQIMLEEKFGKEDFATGKFVEFSEQDIDNLLDLFKQKEVGLPARAKGRLKFDMNAKITHGGQEFNLKSLQERDAEQVFTLYANEMAGRIALAKKGIKSETDFNKILNDAGDLAANEGGEMAKGAKKEALIAQTMYNMIIGRRPPKAGDPDATYVKLSRLVQDYNFMRMMNQVGFAQFAELGNAVQVGGIKGLIRAVPEFRKLIKRAEDGQIQDAVMRDIEAFYGTGSDRMIQQMINRLDYMEGDVQYGGGLLNKAQVRTDQMKRITADISGMAPITTMLERGTARIVAQTLTDMAFDSAKPLTLKRLNSLGLGKKTITLMDGSTKEVDYAKLVFDNIKKNAKVEDSFLFKGKKLRELNLENWDVDAREAFGIALTRWTRRAVQQNDVGNLSLFMTGEMGKILSQFRTFMIVSHAKQLLHNMAMRDGRAGMAMLFSGLTAGSAYIAQQQVKMIGMSEEKKKKFREERLDPVSIAKASFSRSSWASFIPAAIDSTYGFYSDDPVFAYRSTGLDNNFITGNPTYQAVFGGLDALTQATRAGLNPEIDFTEGRGRALGSLIPYQNALGIQNFINMAVEDLPDRSSR
jgi:hypothetical protein